MTDDNTVPQLYNISRRRVLGGLGAIGLASAGAGLGTTAFFSDEEVYENNVLTAGALDLVVDWEEHYSDWSPDESDGLVNAVLMVAEYDALSDEDKADYRAFPSEDDPLIYVHNDDVDQFMDNTSLEAYPDVVGNDGVQDDLELYDACDDFAQLDENLNPDNGRGDGKRTANPDTILNFEAWDGEDADAIPAPLVNLDDVKPGDFGELTLSLHLCDNPGYIWMNGGLVEARENGHTEPEFKDDDEFGAANETSTDVETAQVELLDAIQTMLWYDEDGDNVYEPAGVAGKVDVVLVLDRSGSMQGARLTNAKQAAKDLVDALSLDSVNGAQIGLVSFAQGVSLDHGLSDDGSSVKTAIDALVASGTTNIEGGVRQGHEELIDGDQFAAYGESGNDRPDAHKVMVVLSDGAPNVDDDADGSVDPVDEADDAKADGIEIFTVGFGISAGSSTADTLEDMASDPTDSHAFLADVDEIAQVFGQISQIIAGEERFFQGSLRTLLTLLGTDLGIPLDGNRATEYDEVTDADELGEYVDVNRDCFVDSTTNAIGLAWWLPVDHANEIQTDSVTFDIGFYTEQCRHNSGAGQAPEVNAD